MALNKKSAKALKITGIVVGALLVVYLALSAYGTTRGMEIPREAVVYNPADLGVPYENASFPARGDNVTLKGWFIPGTNADAIMVVNGGYQGRIDDNSDTGGIARALVLQGHNVLLFDLRGRGESEGKGLSLSDIDEDLGGAVDYLNSRGFPAGKICILGFCSGAAEAAIYASRNDVGGLVLVSCFTEVLKMVARQAKSIHAPEFLAYFFWPGGMIFTNLIYRFHVIDPIDIMPKINCPILFIHEEYDDFATSADTLRLLHATPNPANAIWEVPDTLHSQVFRTHPLEFTDKVYGFIRANIGD